MESTRASADEHPVTSSTPCPILNYLINVEDWRERVWNSPAYFRSYRERSGNFADLSRFIWAETFVEKVFKIDLKPKIVFSGKDLTKAEAARLRGNDFFAQGKLGDALAAYNEAIIHSPWTKDVPDNTCLALAFGNRSASFFRANWYVECVRDIDQAVLLGYPVQSVKKLLVRKAKALLALGRPKDAVFVLEKEGKMLNVCRGDVDKICELTGDMQDYADTVVLAFESMSMKVAPRADGEPSQKPIFATGWDRREKAKELKLSEGRGKVFPALSAAVDVRVGDDGRRMEFVANRDVKAGDVLLIEPAFASAVRNRASLTNCYSCLCWTMAPFPCSDCSVVVFCSSVCAASPKAALHARECKFWLTFKVDVQADGEDDIKPQQFMLLALRMMLTKSAEEWATVIKAESLFENPLPLNPTQLLAGGYREEDPLHALWLMTNFGQSKRADASVTEQVMTLAFIAVYMTKVLETEYLSDFAFDARMHRCLGMYVNRTLLACAWERGVAVDVLTQYKVVAPATTARVLHPIYSQITRSCDPDLISIHYGDSLVVRARRSIPKGQTLTAPDFFAGYHGGTGYTRLSRDERRVEFGLARLAPCQCRACVEEWPTMKQLQPQVANMSWKVKCPFCSHPLGTMVWVLLGCDTWRREGCPKCAADGEALFAALASVQLFQQCLATDLPAPTAGGSVGVFQKLMDSAEKMDRTLAGPPCAENLDELIERARVLRSVYVDPCYAIAQADMWVEDAVLVTGNERNDYVLPVSKDDAEAILEMLKAEGGSG